MKSLPSERLAAAADTSSPYRDPNDFDGAAEPMRAIRDLINACELGNYDGDKDILGRARDGFSKLRYLHGDNREAEDIADAAMVEPKTAASLPEIIEALQLNSAALQVLARSKPWIEQTPIYFTGKWLHFAPRTIASILDSANRALEGST